MEHANVGARQPCPTCRTTDHPGLDPKNLNNLCPTCHGSGTIEAAKTPVQRIVRLVPRPLKWMQVLGVFVFIIVGAFGVLLVTGTVKNVSLNLGNQPIGNPPPSNRLPPGQCPDPNHLPAPGQGPPGGPPPGCPTPTFVSINGTQTATAATPTVVVTVTPFHPTPTAFATATAASPTLFVDPLSFLYPSCANQQAVISVQNIGAGTLIWNATLSGAVYTVKPSGGSIPRGGNQMVTISDISGNGAVTITAEAIGSPITVPITCGA